MNTSGNIARYARCIMSGRIPEFEVSINFRLQPILKLADYLKLQRKSQLYADRCTPRIETYDACQRGRPVDGLEFFIAGNEPRLRNYNNFV